MLPQFARTQLLIGETGLRRLQESQVLIFGVGGVGSYAVEALARTGVGKFILVDPDKIEITNLNRQLPALISTIGKFKVELLRERISEINSQAQVVVHKLKVTENNVGKFFQGTPDYILDAIDQVSGKVAIKKSAGKKNLPIISVLGMGNRLDPTQIKIGKLGQTKTCPLARIMRRELRKSGESLDFNVIYSEEKPLKSTSQVGSISFVPAVAGLFAAAKIVNDLLSHYKKL